VTYAGGENFYGNTWVSHPATGFSSEESQLGDGVVGALDFAMINSTRSPTGTAADTSSTPIYNVGVAMEILPGIGSSSPSPAPPSPPTDTPTPGVNRIPTSTPAGTASAVVSSTPIPTPAATGTAGATPKSTTTPAVGSTFPLESSSVVGSATGGFHTELIGNRWWLIAPDGHGDFVRALSKFDTSCCGDQGNFSTYDMVAVKPAGGAASVLTAQGQDANGSDVVVGGVTLKAAGDAIVIGASNFRPEYTYFWLSQLGSGGTVQWYYLSSSGSWRLINGTGKPAAGVVLNSSAGYSMDTGGYYAPDANGFMAGGNPKADRVTWWATGRPNVTPWPTDFAPQVLSTLDATPRYYIEGVVAAAFSTGPGS
jgi:hypothetical protein